MKDINTICPYCGYDLKIMPQRKKKCPSCAQPIYCKYTPDNHTKRLMTKKQADEAEEQWDLHCLRQSSINTLSLFGLGEPEIKKERAMGAKNDDEATFSILSRITILKTNDLNDLKIAYLILASLAAKTGKPFRPFKLAAHHCELLRYKSTNGVVKNVKILTSDNKDICIECQNNKGKIYTIDDAIKLTPLPCPKCTCVGVNGQIGFCDCCYIPVLYKHK